MYYVISIYLVGIKLQAIKYILCRSTKKYNSNYILKNIRQSS